MQIGYFGEYCIKLLQQNCQLVELHPGEAHPDFLQLRIYVEPGPTERLAHIGVHSHVCLEQDRFDYCELHVLFGSSIAIFNIVV